MSPMMRTLAMMLFELAKISAIAALIATASAMLREALKEEQHTPAPRSMLRPGSPPRGEAWRASRAGRANGPARAPYIVPARHTLP